MVTGAKRAQSSYKMRARYLSTAAVLLVSGLGCAQTDDAVSPPPAPAVIPVEGAPVVVPLNPDRIMKIIPDYQTVEDSHQKVAPMTAKEKWDLALKEAVDPFNIGSAAMGAALSQAANQTPKYGHGGEAMAERFGAAIGDFGSQNFLSAGVFATLLHQDPRYFRKGPPVGFWARVGDSLVQIVVARQDSGAKAFNASNIFGMAAGIGLSNVYYPSASRTGTVMGNRVITSLTGDVMGNLMSEFWPDVQKKFFRKKSKN
jgi:hypothetical protein